MWHEGLVVLLMYLVVLAGHALHARHQAALRRRQLAEEARRDLAPLSPLSACEEETPRLRPAHHVAAAIVATMSHPVTVETIKGYVIHFLVYSGYVIRH